MYSPQQDVDITFTMIYNTIAKILLVAPLMWRNCGNFAKLQAPGKYCGDWLNLISI